MPVDSAPRASIGIVGARGHVGGELIRLIATHPTFELAYVSSRELDGQRLADPIAHDRQAQGQGSR